MQCRSTLAPPGTRLVLTPVPKTIHILVPPRALSAGVRKSRTAAGVKPPVKHGADPGRAFAVLRGPRARAKLSTFRAPWWVAQRSPRNCFQETSHGKAPFTTVVDGSTARRDRL